MAGGTANLAEVFLPRLLKKTFPAKRPSDLRILDVGCVSGEGVAHLRVNGYDAWGVELGGRPQEVEEAARPFVRSMSLTELSEKLPELGRFDFIMSNGVIEHVGTVDAEDHLGADAFRDRKSFVLAQLAVLKPGGVLLVAGPNRLFPFDFQHRTHRYGKLAAVKDAVPAFKFLTIPWDKGNFLLSYGDVARLLNAQELEAMKTTQLDYCGLSSLRGRAGLRLLFRTYIRTISLLPHPLRRFLEPHTLFLCRVPEASANPH